MPQVECFLLQRQPRFGKFIDSGSQLPERRGACSNLLKTEIVSLDKKLVQDRILYGHSKEANQKVVRASQNY